MFPGMNPRQMRQVMKKVGMEQEDLSVLQVVFKMQGKALVFDNPSVSKINVMGQESYQVIGTPREEHENLTPDISDDDIETVVDQTGCSRDDAFKALKESDGDLAVAIMNLKK